jgi:predicted DNA binding protein
MPKVRMKLTFSSSVLEFSAEHPGVEFRIQTSWPTEDGLLTIMEINAQDSAAVLSTFDESPDVYAYEVLHTDDRTMLIQISTPDPPPHRVAQAAGELPPFPMVIRNGWIISETTITHERLSEFKDELENADITYEVVSVTQSTDAIELLTDRQRQFIGEAVKRGYYDSPRRCSLTDLATSLEVSKPTASGILHRAEERIIKEFVHDPVK